MSGGDGPKKWRQGICGSLFEKGVNVASSFNDIHLAAPPPIFLKFQLKHRDMERVENP